MPPPPGKRAKTPDAGPSQPAQSAAELRAAAQAALSAGQPQRAYDLAKRSRQQERARSALQLMGRAACRMNDAAKAKAAISGLSFLEARAIRKDCRSRGVRLGL
ncbi:MAG: hypothetical protein B7733_04725 [Myxococcales bacterium FL481]|nr:MAG: hypothetical protein B7733_04725 [Myxococcales bacterium FL481]